MSKQTETNLFIVSSMPRLYQELLSGVVSYEALGNRIVKQIRAAHAFRQVEQVRELARILINIPIKEYQLIAQYYLAWCKCRDLEYHTDTLERIAEQTQTYKAKALISRAAFEVYRGNIEQAFYFYNEALKTNPIISDYIKASTGIATLKSMEGFNKSALTDLENLIPLLRHADPLNHFEVINSYAVELIQNNRVSEAQSASLIAVSSPFGPFYPEWHATLSDARSQRKSRSTMSMWMPQEQHEVEVETSEPSNNVIKFPTGEKLSDDIPDLSMFTGIELTPLQLLGVILKVVLKDRITDDEVDRICSVYYETIMKVY
jgi:tetratricopeptide (TPR) repeat protein